MARILLADDDPILRATAGAYLTDAGHDVREACDGVAALQRLGQETFDLLILDMLMPEMDGLEVILEVRRTGSTLPILAISSGGRMDVSSLLRPAAAFGATSTMSKPLLRDPLLMIVNSLLPDVRPSQKS